MRTGAIKVLWVGVSGLMFCLCGGCAGPRGGGWKAGGADTGELERINSRLTGAYLREDVDVLRSMLAEGHVHNNVFGAALEKDEFLRDIESGVLVFESYETPEIQWYIDGDTAVATGEISARAVRGGKRVPAERFRFTRVFVRENGEWKVLLFQNTMAGVAGGG